MNPASTSPEPAVASQGGAFSLIAARPSGAATQVSAPFKHDDGAALGCRVAGAIEAGPGHRPEQALKLAVVGRQDSGSAWGGSDRIEEPVRRDRRGRARAWQIAE